ncbi:DUF4056 domain-containing protein [Escherichia coli]|uniref:DUF4056 domain-containing protein n=1 Tax=Escherichia coli TaxID=562 RepID=UPI0021D1E855
MDTAHVRDTADMTVWIFPNLWPRLGEAFSLNPGREELVQRRLVFRAFTPPPSSHERYILAAQLVWQLAAWHEIAQWYGFESVPGFSEEVSAFSPEDLWSNMLGARIAESLILSGHVSDRRMYEVAMGQALQQALVSLGAVTHTGTRARLRQLDGIWWDNQRVLPDKWLLRRRNYDMADVRYPTTASWWGCFCAVSGVPSDGRDDAGSASALAREEDAAPAGPDIFLFCGRFSPSGCHG